MRRFFPAIRKIGPGGLLGQELHRDSRAQPVPYQTSVCPHLERAQSHLLLRAIEPLLDVPEGPACLDRERTHYLLRCRSLRCVADHVLHLTRRALTQVQKPLPSVRWDRHPARRLGLFRMHERRLVLPHAGPSGRLLHGASLPLLISERRTESAEIVDSPPTWRRRPGTGRWPRTTSPCDGGSLGCPPQAAARVRDAGGQHPVESLMVPDEEREELLHVPHRHVYREGDGLDALALEVGHEFDEIDRQILSCAFALETVTEISVPCLERRVHRLYLRCVHARSPGMRTGVHRLEAAWNLGRCSAVVLVSAGLLPSAWRGRSRCIFRAARGALLLCLGFDDHRALGARIETQLRELQRGHHQHFDLRTVEV